MRTRSSPRAAAARPPCARSRAPWPGRRSRVPARLVRGARRAPVRGARGIRRPRPQPTPPTPPSPGGPAPARRRTRRRGPGRCPPRESTSRLRVRGRPRSWRTGPVWLRVGSAGAGRAVPLGGRLWLAVLRGSSTVTESVVVAGARPVVEPFGERLRMSSRIPGRAAPPARRPAVPTLRRSFMRTSRLSDVGGEAGCL